MILYLIASALFLVLTLLAASRKRMWWSKVSNILAPYILAATMFLFIAGLVTMNMQDPVVILVEVLLLAAIIRHFRKILCFTQFAKREIADYNGRKGTRIRVFTANVLMHNREYDQLLTMIRENHPDVVLLTETDQKWIEGVKPLHDDYSYCHECPQDNTYGIAVYSRIPFRFVETRFLVEDNVPSIYAELLLNEKHTVQLIGLHPRPPAPWTFSENKDIELIKAAGMVNWNLKPTIVTGDLNDVGWSQVTNEFKVISEMGDPRIGRGFLNTFNAKIPFMRVPIDHIFLSTQFKLVKMDRLGYMGSDHFPVLVEAVLEDE